MRGSRPGRCRCAHLIHKGSPDLRALGAQACRVHVRCPRRGNHHRRDHFVHDPRPARPWPAASGRCTPRDSVNGGSAGPSIPSAKCCIHAGGNRSGCLTALRRPIEKHVTGHGWSVSESAGEAGITPAKSCVPKKYGAGFVLLNPRRNLWPAQLRAVGCGPGRRSIHGAPAAPALRRCRRVELLLISPSPRNTTCPPAAGQVPCARSGFSPAGPAGGPRVRPGFPSPCPWSTRRRG